MPFTPPTCNVIYLIAFGRIKPLIWSGAISVLQITAAACRAVEGDGAANPKMNLIDENNTSITYENASF
jgi:hypothetical protein